MSAELIHKMYIAYYQRPADPAGLNYWVDQLSSNGGGEAGWNAVAAAFANAAESSALYGNQTLGQKISAIYEAAFERSASADEVSFWEASGFNAAQIGFALVNGAQNDDLSTVNKKLAYSTEFVAILDPAGTGSGPFSFVYDDPALGRTLMDPITKDSTVTSSTVSSDVNTNLPQLNPVNLSAGQDTVVGTKDVEVIEASLGGSVTTLDRSDVIDGGSGNDIINIAADASFLLGFGTGRMSGVETVNIGATQSSVTPKIFNFTGASGIQTINVGAANAKVELKEVSDPGVTVNLSGQTSGTLKLDFASGTISGSGSAMTFGVANVGTTTGDVGLQADGITDLTVNSLSSGGQKNYITLNNGANDIQTLTLTGTTDLYIGDVGNTVTAVDASGMGGDFTLSVNVSGNGALLASGQTLTGGQGFDTLRLLGSGNNIVRATINNVEELFFDGAGSKPNVKANLINDLTHLRFSGQAVDGAVDLSGLQSGALTVNAIMNDTKAGGADSQDISAQGALTVNMNASDTAIANAAVEQNNFSFSTPTQDAVTVNIGAYVSASSTLSLNDAGSLSVNVDSTSDFNGTINAQGASSIVYTGGGSLTGSIIGSAATSISIASGSGDGIDIRSTGLETLNLNFTNGFSIISTSNIDSAQNITMSAGATADLSQVGTFTKAANITLSGGSATYIFDNISNTTGVDTTLVLSGGSGGFSAQTLDTTNAAIVVDGSAFDGAINITQLDGTSPSTGTSVVVTLGSTSSFSGNTIGTAGDFTMTGTSGSGEATANITLGNDFTAGGDATISIDALGGDYSAGQMDVGGNLILNLANFGGSVTTTNLTTVGDATISTGSSGHFSAGSVDVVGDLTLNMAAHVSGTANITLTTLGTANNATLILGQGGIGDVSVGETNVVAGDLLIDGSGFGGSVGLTSIIVSGNATFISGTSGNFSANSVTTSAGDFVFSGGAHTSGTGEVQFTTLNISGGIAMTLGAGAGSFSANLIEAGEDITIDAGSYSGSMIMSGVSASGNLTVNIGKAGEILASSLLAYGDISINAQNTGAVSADMNLTSVTANGSNITLALGSHSGTVSAGVINGSTVIIDGAQSSGAMVFNTIAASSDLTISISKSGSFTAEDVKAVGDITFSAAAHSTGTGAIVLASMTASGATTISLGAGSGAFTAGSIDSAQDMILDGANFGGTMNIGSVTGSGDVTIAAGSGGKFSSGVILADNLSVNFSSFTSGSANQTFTNFSASGAVTITLGAGTGSFALQGSAVANSFAIDGSNYGGATDITRISATGTLSVTLGSSGDFSAGQVDAGLLSINAANATATSEITLTSVTGSATSIVLGAAAVNSSFSGGTIQNANDVAVGGATYQGSMDITTVSGSGVTITTGVKGDFSASDVDAVSFTLNGGAGISGATVNLTSVSASDNVNITLGTSTGGPNSNASGIIADGSFTFSATGEKSGQITMHDISASGVTIGVGLGTRFSGSVINTMAGGFNMTTNGGTGVVIIGGLDVGSAGGSITLGAGSGSLTLGTDINGKSAIGITSDGSFTIDASQSTQDNAISVNNAYFSATASYTVLTGTKGDFAGGSSTTVEGGDFILTQGGSGTISLSETTTVSGNITINVAGGTLGIKNNSGTAQGISAGGLISINGASDGSADINIGGISASAISIVMAGAGRFSAHTLDGTGGSATVSLSTVNSGSVDVVIGGAVTTSAGMVFTLGANKGDLNLQSSIEVKGGDFVIDGQNLFTGSIELDGKLSASGVTITLGEAKLSGHGFSASAIIAHGNVTLNASQHQEDINIATMISASSVSITIGEQTDSFVAGSVNAAVLDFNGGTGGGFSATFTEINYVGASGFSIVMGQDNNGLTISGMSAAQGGLIRGTDEGDVISVTATNAVRATFEVDLRDNDNQADRLTFGSAVAAAVGPTLVKITGFDGTASGTANSDKLFVTAMALSTVGTAAISAQTAADLIGAALSDTVGSGAVALVGVTADFTWSYQGDVFYLGEVTTAAGTLATFGTADAIFQFVGGLDQMNGGDILG